MPRIAFGIELANTESWEALREAALAADSQRWHTIWTYDHLVVPTAEELPLSVSSREESDSGPLLEGWTLLAAMEALTRRVRTGCMVSAVTFRHPALLAKIAVTVDHVSGGRAILGLGAGWHEGEHEAFGLRLGGMSERQDRLEEAAALIRLLLDSLGRSTFEGSFFHLREAPFSPSPRQARLPLLIAGGGEKRTLRTVARYADAANLHGNLFGSLEEVVRKLKVLDGHCESIRRDPREVRRTVTLYADLVDDLTRRHVGDDNGWDSTCRRARWKLCPSGSRSA